MATQQETCRAGALGLMAAGLMASAGGAFAQPSLYVAEYKFQGAIMTSVGADGSSPATVFSMSASQWLPIGLAVNPATNKLYWTDSAGPSRAVSANLNGTGNTVLTTVPGFARGASLDAQGRIFLSSNNTLYRVNANGTGLTALYTDAAADPLGMPFVDAVNGNVYVGIDGQIVRFNLDGGEKKVIVRGVATPRAVRVDVASGHVYWIDSNTNTDFVGRARLDGSDFTVLIDNSPLTSGSSGLSDLLVDPASGTLFYSDELRGDVRRAAIDGTGVTQIYASTNERSPSGLAFSTGSPAQPVLDCNSNGIADAVEIAGGAPDCDNNGFLDSCQVSACSVREFVLNQGTDPVNTAGRAVGQPSSWQVFQPFDVPAEGWRISEVGLDGFTSQYGDGSGVNVTLYPDDGSGVRPDEATSLGSASLGLLFNTSQENYRYAPLSATLSQGRYWAVVSANSPTLVAVSLNFGTSGLPSKSRGTSGNFTANASPIAIQFTGTIGGGCAADFNADGFVDDSDFVVFAAAYEAFTVPPADGACDLNGDGFVDDIDFVEFAAAYEAFVCP